MPEHSGESVARHLVLRELDHQSLVRERLPELPLQPLRHVPQEEHHGHRRLPRGAMYDAEVSTPGREPPFEAKTS